MTIHQTVCLLLVLTVTGAAVPREAVEGPWEGSLKITGVELNIRVIFISGDEGLEATIDIPQQGARGMPLKNVSLETGKVHFELPAGPGLAVFDGTLEESVIQGVFTQAGVKGTFAITRGDPAADSDETAAAEEVSEPRPYHEEKVRFRNGDVGLAGTLTLPATEQRQDSPGEGARGREVLRPGYRRPGGLRRRPCQGRAGNGPHPPWYRHFLDYDPDADLKSVSCPVLALYGGLDLQVPASLNEPALRLALEAGNNPNLTVKTYPNANHLFQEARTGLPAEYPFLDKEFTEGFVEGIQEWINANLDSGE